MKRNKFEWNDRHCIYTNFPSIALPTLSLLSFLASLCSYVIILFFYLHKNGLQQSELLFYEQQHTKKQSTVMASAGSKDFYIFINFHFASKIDFVSSAKLKRRHQINFIATIIHVSSYHSRFNSHCPTFGLVHCSFHLPDCCSHVVYFNCHFCYFFKLLPLYVPFVTLASTVCSASRIHIEMRNGQRQCTDARTNHPGSNKQWKWLLSFGKTTRALNVHKTVLLLQYDLCSHIAIPFTKM